MYMCIDRCTIMCEGGHSGGHWWVGGAVELPDLTNEHINLVTTKRPHRRRCPNGRWKERGIGALPAPQFMYTPIHPISTYLYVVFVHATVHSYTRIYVIGGRGVEGLNQPAGIPTPFSSENK